MPSPSPAPATKERGSDVKMKEQEGGRRGAGEKKKREKNAGYARLIFRASEECAEAPLVSPFSVYVPMKRDGEVAGLRVFCHHLVKAEPLLIFSSSGVPRPLHMSYPPVAIAMPPHVVDSEC